AARRTCLPVLADGGQSTGVLAAVLPVPGESAEHKGFVRETVIAASYDVSARVVRARLLVAVILVGQDRRISEIGQREEAVLYFLRHRANARCGDNVAREGRIGAEEIADYRAWSEPREVASAPGLERHGGSEELLDLASPRGFESK